MADAPKPGSRKDAAEALYAPGAYIGVEGQRMLQYAEEADKLERELAETRETFDLLAEDADALNKVRRELAAIRSEQGTPPPSEPTIAMLRVIVYGSQWPEDWEIGKLAQRDGKPIPSKTEYEKAYGFYKRIIAGQLPAERPSDG